MTTYAIMGQTYWNAQQCSDEHHEVATFTICRERTIRYRQDGHWLLDRSGRRILGRDIQLIVRRLDRVRDGVAS